MSPVFYRVLALLIAVGSGLFLRDPLPNVGPAQELAFEAADDPVEVAANSNRRRASPTRLERASNTSEAGSEWMLLGDDGDAPDGWELPLPPRIPAPGVLGLELDAPAYDATADDGKPASTLARGPPAQA